MTDYAEWLRNLDCCAACPGVNIQREFDLQSIVDPRPIRFTAGDYLITKTLVIGRTIGDLSHGEKQQIIDDLDRMLQHNIYAAKNNGYRRIENE